MRLADLNNKRVLIFGFGKEGHVVFRLLRKRFPHKYIDVADDQTLKIKDSRLIFHKSKNILKHLKEFDVIIKSPGVASTPEIKKVTKHLTSATQLFFDNLDPSNVVIGVTGSKGKSTVASITAQILRRAQKRVRLVGNIGIPALTFTKEKNTIFVYELSSYQLEYLRAAPHIAVITTFFPEHLDYHGSFQYYWQAKTNITRFQKHADYLIVPHASPVLRNFKTKARKIVCGDQKYFWRVGNTIYEKNKKLFKLGKTKLLGEHNTDNILLAVAIARILKIPSPHIKKTVEQFPGLPHRLQFIGQFNHITFYDDAISTAPESTIAAIEVFKHKIGTIILGGQDRGYDFTALVKTIKKYSIKNIILFPESGKQIKKNIVTMTKRNIFSYYDAVSMESAVRYAYQHTPKDTVCLLSTASPSYGMFKNFEEKGDAFQKYVKHYAKKGD